MNFLRILATDPVDTRIKPICNVLEKKMQSLILDKDYGVGITEWEHIVFCDSLEFYATKFLKEIKRYTKYKTKVQSCCWIDSEQVQESDEKEIYRLICQSLLTSMYNLSNIKDFDYKEFHENIIAL